MTMLAAHLRERSGACEDPFSGRIPVNDGPPRG